MDGRGGGGGFWRDCVVVGVVGFFLIGKVRSGGIGGRYDFLLMVVGVGLV